MGWGFNSVVSQASASASQLAQQQIDKLLVSGMWLISCTAVQIQCKHITVLIY